MPAKRFVIIGLGNFGGSIAEALYEHGHDVIALDISKNRVGAIAAHVSRSAVADGNERDVLKDLSVQEMVVPEKWQGRTLCDLELRSHFGLTVVALHDVESDEAIVPPDPDRKLSPSDSLLIAGREIKLNEVTTAE